ncbi:type II 3-dehydroquinate dehydratase [Angelakisella massiliensis]|uniref:type II 3-dehydroquinate dehydratase n=1 Tax=Angelakisella massiliensis TaxID=1871018 RepID=UPI0008F93C42|nr:type II 3-dehydroquinate dehydratase [Angelakisella massiliensis]
MKLLVIHGPNLNMLGIREKKIYGAQTYEDLLEYIRQICAREGIEVKFYQSNHEGDLVDAIQGAYYDQMDGIIINPGAYTHTSIALLDAVKAVQIPTVEVHLSNIYEREEFRHTSYISLGCIHSYYGMGFQGYEEAVNCLKNYWNS